LREKSPRNGKKKNQMKSSRADVKKTQIREEKKSTVEMGLPRNWGKVSKGLWKTQLRRTGGGKRNGNVQLHSPTRRMKGILVLNTR